MLLVDRSTRDLIAAFASSDPTPGGGSASALSSSVGAALLTMVAGLPKTRHNSEEDRAKLQAASAALQGIRQQLVDAIDADTAAYDQVVAAYRLPKASAEEVQARKDAIQHALRAATDVPLGVVRLSADALRQASIVAAHGYRSAASDIGVAAAMLHAGATGAKLNVAINVDSVKDETYVASVRDDVQQLMESVERDRQTIERALQSEPKTT